MKGQDVQETRLVYDVYLTRDGDTYFSRRYLTARGAEKRADQLDYDWGRVGCRAEVRPVAVLVDGPEDTIGGRAAGTPPQKQGNPPTE